MRHGKKSLIFFPINLIFSSFWSIDDTTPSFLDFENYEVHHWGMVAGGVITLFTMLAYYLVFRKHAKYRHLMPSSKGKSSYEQLDDEDDEDTYTYDEESPRLKWSFIL